MPNTSMLSEDFNWQTITLILDDPISNTCDYFGLIHVYLIITLLGN